MRPASPSRSALRRPSLLLAAPVALALLLSACGDEGSSKDQAGASPSASTSAPAPAASDSASATPSDSASAAATSCEAVAGDDLVVLTDDKKLQTVDNIIPAISTGVAKAPLTTALDKVSAALSQDALNALNKKTDISRVTPVNAAKAFVSDNKLGDGLSGGSGKIVVGAANFSENQTVANIYAGVLDAAGYDASVKTLGNRELYEPSLEKGAISVVPEYAGTLTEFLNKKQNGATAKPIASGDLDATVQGLTGLGTKAKLSFGKPAAAADQNAFATTKAFADKYQVTTLSELGAKCGSGLVLGGPPECPQRPFCQPGLESSYSLTFGSFTSLDAGGPLSKNALKSGKVALALVFSSDASLAG